MRNFFGLALEGTAAFLGRYPRGSACTAAVFLSLVWTMSWLAAFFLATWFFNLSTTTADFVCLFWLALAAESVTRWAENTNFITGLNRPRVREPVPFNSRYHWRVAAFMCALSIALMFLIDRYLERVGLRTEPVYLQGQEANSHMAMVEMYRSWIAAFDSGNIMLWLLIGTVVRAVIYYNPENI